MANSKMTQLWFSKAKGDLLAAKYLEQAGDDHLYVSIAFHCQQSAEKAIKGYLTYNNKRVLKTHDMEKLLKTLHSIKYKLRELYDMVCYEKPHAMNFSFCNIIKSKLFIK